MAHLLKSLISINATDGEEEDDDAVNTKIPAMRIMKLKLVQLEPIEIIDSERTAKTAEKYDGSEDTHAPRESVPSMESKDQSDGFDVPDEIIDSEITAKTAEKYVQKFIHRLKIKHSVQNKTVHESLQNTMQHLPGHFSVHICCHRKTVIPEMSRIINTFADADTLKESRPMEHENFLIFLTRELRAKESDPLLKYAETFVLTTGNAYSIIPKGVRDENFPSKIARRVLEFTLVRSLSSKQLTGLTTSTAQTYREGKSLTFWDYLGQITTSYKMPLRSDSCLYRLRCFTTKTGKMKPVSLTVGEDFLKVHQKMSLKDFASLLHQLSKIYRGQESHKFLTSEPEVDNTDFDVFDHVKIMKGKHFVKKQDERLKEMLQDCLEKKQKVRMLLSHKKLESWNEANEFLLQAKSSEQRRHVTLEVWYGSPPSIDAIFDVVRNQHTFYQLDSLFLQFQDTSKERPKKIKDSLLMFVEGHCGKQSGMSLFRYCGQWLKIENEYMTHLEKEFNDIVVKCCQDSNVILPLPWPFSGCDVPEKSAKVKNQKENIRQSLPTTNDTFMTWFQMLYGRKLALTSVAIPSGDVDFDIYPGKHKKRQKMALRVFLRLHCQQTEAQYNEGYIWHDRIVKKDGSGYLLGDRIFMKNLELYDILFYTPDTTYLIQVKEGFGNTTRDACSQIRISADFVFRNFICNSKFDILKKMWETVTTFSAEKDSKYRSAVRDRYLRLTEEDFVNLFERKDIVYVLAVRDTRKVQIQEFPLVLYPEEKLQKAFGADTKSVIDELLRSNYLELSGEKIRITDKVMCKTVKKAKQEIKLKSGAQSGKAFSILRQTMSKHKSYITKMEIVHLFNHFKHFRTPNRSLSLKMCFIDQTLPVY